jgi:bile acid:Na+ symporter, BASS family
MPFLEDALMNLAALLPIVLKTSLFLIVLGLGFKATLGDLMWLLRHPGLLVRSVLGMYVLLPLVAAAVAIAANLNPAVEIALVLMAASPIPPVLPGKLIKATGNESHAYSLLVMLGLMSVVVMPLVIHAVGAFFGLQLRVPPSLILQTVLTTILLPLAVGMIVKGLLPGVAARLSPIVAGLGPILLLIAALPIFIKAWPLIISLTGNGSVAAIVAMVLIGLTIGHLLGGPEEEGRTVLALATATRHPGIAIAVGQALFPDQRLVPAAVLLYLLVSLVASLPYTVMRKRGHAHPGMPKAVER